jgi:hypothetical protein
LQEITMDMATLKLVMPLFEKLLDKIFELFSDSTSKYSESNKTEKDLKTLLDDLNKDIKDPEFLEMIRKYDPQFSIEGDVDTPAEVRAIKDVLVKLMNDPATSAQDRGKIQEIVNTLEEAAVHMEKLGGKGGEEDLKVQTTNNMMPASPGGYPQPPTLEPRP